MLQVGSKECLLHLNVTMTSSPMRVSFRFSATNRKKSWSWTVAAPSSMEIPTFGKLLTFPFLRLCCVVWRPGRSTWPPRSNAVNWSRRSAAPTRRIFSFFTTTCQEFNSIKTTQSSTFYFEDWRKMVAVSFVSKVSPIFAQKTT